MARPAHRLAIGAPLESLDAFGTDLVAVVQAELVVLQWGGIE
jgi:hypothetical protein